MVPAWTQISQDANLASKLEILKVLAPMQLITKRPYASGLVRNT